MTLSRMTESSFIFRYLQMITAPFNVYLFLPDRNSSSAFPQHMTSIRRCDEWPALNSPRKSSSVHTEVTRLQWNSSTHFTIYYQLTCTVILLEIARDTILPEKVQVISKLQFSRVLSFLLMLWNPSSLAFE